MKMAVGQLDGVSPWLQLRFSFKMGGTLDTHAGQDLSKRPGCLVFGAKEGFARHRLWNCSLRLDQESRVEG